MSNPPAALDLNVAKANIVKQIEEKQAELTQLQATHAFLVKQSDDVLTMLRTIQTYGRVPKAPKVELAVSSLSDLPPGASQRDIIVAILASAPQPVRTADIRMIAREHNLKLNEKNVSPALVSLTHQGRAVRKGHGLYWRPGKMKDRPEPPPPPPLFADAEENDGATVHLHSGPPRSWSMEDFENLIFELIPEKGAPGRNAPTLTKLVEERGYPFNKQSDHQGAVARAIKRLGNKVKMNGMGKHANYNKAK